MKAADAENTEYLRILLEAGASVDMAASSVRALHYNYNEIII
jgi:hypothetical protein